MLGNDHLTSYALMRPRRVVTTALDLARWDEAFLSGLPPVSSSTTLASDKRAQSSAP